jgi:putative FmdB family regulatory protein
VPLYEYECASCGSFELIRKFSDPPLKKCPKCGRRVEKQLSAPAIQFKGTGWYITDYARKSPGTGEKAGDAGADKKPAADAKAADPAKKSDTGKKAGARGKAGSS